MRPDARSHPARRDVRLAIFCAISFTTSSSGTLRAVASREERHEELGAREIGVNCVDANAVANYLRGELLAEISECAAYRPIVHGAQPDQTRRHAADDDHPAPFFSLHVGQYFPRTAYGAEELQVHVRDPFVIGDGAERSPFSDSTLAEQAKDVATSETVDRRGYEAEADALACGESRAAQSMRPTMIRCLSNRFTVSSIAASRPNK